MVHGLGSNKEPDGALSREELQAFFFAIKYGNTVQQAVEKLGLDNGRVQRSLDDLKIRRFVVDLSMVARVEKEILDASNTLNN